MLMRMWRGSVPKAKHAAYVEYVKQTGYKESLEAAGNRGACVLSRDLGDEVEVLFLSFWDSLDAIQAYVGGDYTRVRYFPEDAKFLTTFSALADHFVMVAGSWETIQLADE